MKINNRRIRLLIAVFGIISACAGCSSVGNILISPHPYSLTKSTVQELNINTPTETCPVVTQKVSMTKSISAASAVIKEFLEVEAKKYSASYSAAGHYNKNFVDIESLSLENKNDSKLVSSFQTTFTPTNLLTPPQNLNNGTKEYTAFQLTNSLMHICGFHSKVAAWPLLTIYKKQNPWAGKGWSSKIGNTIGVINPIMIFHFIYGLIDPDIYKVDTKVKVRVDAVALSNGQTALLNFADLTLSMGKVDIFDLPLEIEESEETSYLAFPRATKNMPLPTNITVTVIEGNGFGDLIGKGEKLID